MGPKQYIRNANQTGKSISVVPVEGEGNCFYRCLAAAGLPLSNCLKPTFKSFKAFILKYFLSDECQSLLNSDLISNYPGFSGFGSEWNRDNLTHSLVTNGYYAEDIHLQLAALALQKTIVARSIASPWEIIGVFPGVDSKNSIQAQMSQVLNTFTCYSDSKVHFQSMTDRKSTRLNSSHSSVSRMPSSA